MNCRVLSRLIEFWLVIVLLGVSGAVSGREVAVLSQINASQLPSEVRITLKLIRNGGPFPYAKDGRTFGNYEGVLPKRKRGYYHEFTVKTPGLQHRGARRIVAGGEPEFTEFYYTENHYRTFKRIVE
jgi:ribonuclease T1